MLILIALYYAACFIAGTVAVLVIILPLPIGAGFILGIERWHKYGEPWSLNIGLALLWVVFYCSFLAAGIQLYSGVTRDIIQSVERLNPNDNKKDK